MEGTTTITNTHSVSVTTQSSITHTESFNLASFALVVQILRSQTPMDPSDQGIMFVAPTLVGLLQCKYQGSSKSPFDTHPCTMHIAFGAFLIFFVAYTLPFKYSLGRGHLQSAWLAKRCKVWSGNVSVASLSSVFLPESIWPLLYAVGVALSEPELLYWLCKKSAQGSKGLGTRYFSRVFDKFAPTQVSNDAA